MSGSISIQFFGFSSEEADGAMPSIVKELKLGFDPYSAVCLPPTSLYDQAGTYTEVDGQAIVIPSFAALVRTEEVAQDTVNRVSAVVRNTPVSMAFAGGVVAAMNGEKL